VIRSISIATRCLASLLLSVAAVRSAGAVEVEVKLLGSSAPLHGELAALGTSVDIVTSQGRKSIASQEVLSVNFAPIAPSEKPVAWVELIDGSKLQAVQIGSDAGKTKLELIGGTKVEVPARSVQSIRFKTQDSDIARQWREIGGGVGMAQGDVLVIRKVSQRTVEEEGSEPKIVTETALDQLEGTVLGIKGDKLNFDYAGDKVDVGLEKVEGVFFFSAVKRELPPPTCKLVEAGGSQWSLKSVELRENGVAGVTTSNVSLVVPLDQIAKIDYSAGNVLFLGDAEPDKVDLSVGLQPDRMQAKFDRLYQSWQNRRFGASGLTLGGIKYEKGLGLSSRTQVSYRVPEGFNHFRALAGIDDAVEQAGGVTVTILGDNKQLFTQQFDGEHRGPIEIDLSIKGVRRLTIAVLPDQSQGFGDLVNLCEARLTK
jgi:hypothetical protein